MLEETLNQNNLGINFSVIDKGLPGTNTEIIVSQLQDNLDKYDPDMVIAMMGINDQKDSAAYKYAPIKNASLSFGSFRTYKLAKLLWLRLLDKNKKANLMRKENKAIKVPREECDAYIDSALSCENRGDYQKAEEMLKRAAEAFPKNYRAHFELGRRYYHKGDHLRCEKNLKKAMAIDPTRHRAYRFLAWSYRNQGKDLECEKILEEAAIKNTRKHEAYLSLAWHYRDKGDYAKSKEALKKAAKTIPFHAVTYSELAWWYRDFGDYDRSEEMIEEALEMYPENDKLYNILGFLYEEQGKNDSAEKCYAKINALRRNHYNPETKNNYLHLKQMVTEKGAELVCMQYPLRSVTPLKEMLNPHGDIIFVDNEKVFKDALKQGKYGDYFVDMLGCDFGHCTEKGNRLLAKNIAHVLLEEFALKSF